MSDQPAEPSGASLLEPAHLARYREQGWFTLPRLLVESEVEAACREITRIVDGEVTGEEKMIQWEPRVLSGEVTAESSELAVRKLFHVAVHNDFFRDLAFHPRLVAIAQALLGDDVFLAQTMLLMKPPHVSTEKVWHQDNAYFRLSPSDIFGFWIALDEATVENGCMHVVSGSHRRGIVEHDGTGDLYSLTETPPPESVTPVPLSPGDALIFHGELFHYTPENRTDRRRRGIQYHYASSQTTRDGRGHWLDFEPELSICGHFNYRELTDELE